MSGRSLRIALIVSIIVNIFVIGIVVGSVYRAWQTAGPPLLGPRVARLAQAADALPGDQRQLYRQNIRAAVLESRPYGRAAREARSEALAAFVEPGFDRAKVEAALDRARAADFAVRTRAEQAILDSAAKLDVTARTALAQGLRLSGPLRQPQRKASGDGSATTPR